MGLTRRGSSSIKVNIFLLSQTWLPIVRQSIPIPSNSSLISKVKPRPPAAFSALAMVKLMSCWVWTFASRLFKIALPGLPTISPITSIFNSHNPPSIYRIQTSYPDHGRQRYFCKVPFVYEASAVTVFLNHKMNRPAALFHQTRAIKPLKNPILPAEHINQSPLLSVKRYPDKKSKY